MIIAVYIRNFCSCEKKAWKKFSLVRDSSPWPLRYQCSALPTYQANWEQVVECAFATAKVCIWLRWDDHPSFDSSLRSSHIWFSYLHNLTVRGTAILLNNMKRQTVLTARRWRSKHWKKKTKNIFKHLYFMFYSFLYFFIALPQGSVCRVIFFYKFNCTDPGLQLGDPAPLIGLLLWTCWHFIYFAERWDISGAI